MTQPAISKMLKKYAKSAHENCKDIPLDLHAYQFRHSKVSHWLEDGMNIVQISFLLGHEQFQTTMVYLDITTEEKTKALATLEDENDKKVSAKWNNSDGSLKFLRCPKERIKIKSKPFQILFIAFPSSTAKGLDFFRHSHASLLIEQGFPPLLISERLGHEKIQTTLQTYSHLYPNKHNLVADKLQELNK